MINMSERVGLTNEQIKARFGEHLTAILSEMCRRVGATLDEVDFTDNNWYWQHSWTEKEQDEFETWLTDYLFNNNDARREITTVFYKNKKRLAKTAKMFCFNFGWKVKEKE